MNRLLIYLLILLPGISCRRGLHAKDGCNSEALRISRQFEQDRAVLATLQISYPDSALKLVQRLAARAEYRRYPALLMRCYVNQCQTLCLYKKDLITGRLYADSARRLAAQYPHLEYKSCFAEGICAMAGDHYEKAEHHFLQSIRGLPPEGDTTFTPTLYNSISSLYCFQHNYSKALEYVQPLLNVSGKSASTSMDALAFLNAYCYAAMAGQDSAAQSYLYTARQIAAHVQDSGLNAMLYFNIATRYLEMKLYDSTERYARRSLSYMSNIRSAASNPAKNYLLLADVYIAQQQYNQAAAMLQNIYRYADTAALSLTDKILLARYGYQVSRHRHRTLEALHWMESYFGLTITLHHNEMSGQLLNFERIKERYSEQQKMEKKNRELSTHKFYNVILSLMAMLISLTGILAYWRWKKRKELIRKETELLLLRKEVESKNQLLAERNRIAREMHDDLGSTLTSTMIAVEMLHLDQGSQESLKVIQDNAQKLWQQINEVIWNLNTHNDSIQKLSNHLISYARGFLQQARIRFRFEEQLEDAGMQVSGAKRRKIFLMVKELLNNVVRHAQASLVLLRVEQKAEALSICVEDNGIGFQPDKPADTDREHYGLNNIRNQVQELNGHLNIYSNKGTSVCFTIQLDQA